MWAAIQQAVALLEIPIASAGLYHFLKLIRLISYEHAPTLVEPAETPKDPRCFGADQALMLVQTPLSWVHLCHRPEFVAALVGNPVEPPNLGLWRRERGILVLPEGAAALVEIMEYSVAEVVESLYSALRWVEAFYPLRYRFVAATRPMLLRVRLTVHWELIVERNSALVRR